MILICDDFSQRRQTTKCHCQMFGVYMVSITDSNCDRHAASGKENNKTQSWSTTSVPHITYTVGSIAYISSSAPHNCS